MKMRRIGKNMKNLLDFAQRYPGWHSINPTDRGAENAALRLQQRELLEINEFNQFRFYPPRAKQ